MTSTINWPFGNTGAKTIATSDYEAIACIISLDNQLLCSGSSETYGYISDDNTLNSGSYYKNISIAIPGDGIHQIEFGTGDGQRVRLEKRNR